ncbi:hypothetical protein BZG36_04746 [Bifiguratus adelaidae]|uniref:Uncharacterized protein n=1 Tax=Bifiguratus adelaidae TaxID=1938954 RepID=A0A261XV07_9FUNG|nr:hypothetical protein BZG36_04746 [Bifiguratus adelaidae]
MDHPQDGVPNALSWSEIIDAFDSQREIMLEQIKLEPAKFSDFNVTPFSLLNALSPTSGDLTTARTTNTTTIGYRGRPSSQPTIRVSNVSPIAPRLSEPLVNREPPSPVVRTRSRLRSIVTSVNRRLSRHLSTDSEGTSKADTTDDEAVKNLEKSQIGTTQESFGSAKSPMRMNSGRSTASAVVKQPQRPPKMKRPLFRQDAFAPPSPFSPASQTSLSSPSSPQFPTWLPSPSIHPLDIPRSPNSPYRTLYNRSPSPTTEYPTVLNPPSPLRYTRALSFDQRPSYPGWKTSDWDFPTSDNAERRRTWLAL